MDPEQEQALPAAWSEASPSLHRSPSGTSRASSCNSSQQLQPELDIVLRISPASGFATFGILIAETERHLQDAITAHYDSVGRVVTVLPCPHFANFLTDHSLHERNVSLVSNLPRYIGPAGNSYPSSEPVR